MTSDDGRGLIGEAQWRELQAIVDELGGQGLDELLTQAQADARSRVRAILADAMTTSMLNAAAHRRVRSPATQASEPAASRPSESPVVPSASAAGLGLYVYGILSAEEAAAVPGSPGIDAGHAVTTLQSGDLAAAVSSVPLDEFDEERLREHLGDMAWVERVARRHEEVLDATAAAVTVIPMRMCSIFRDRSGVRAMLDREAPAMRHALRELRGKAEWGVKIFRAPVAPATHTEDSAPQTGAGYLERQSQARHERERAGAALSARCEAIHVELCGLSARAALLAPQRPEVSGHRGEMLLNAAYLVEDVRLGTFQAGVQRLGRDPASEGLDVRLTGPWPAYNFVPDAIGSLA